MTASPPLPPRPTTRHSIDPIFTGASGKAMQHLQASYGGDKRFSLNQSFRDTDTSRIVVDDMDVRLIIRLHSPPQPMQILPTSLHYVPYYAAAHNVHRASCIVHHAARITYNLRTPPLATTMLRPTHGSALRLTNAVHSPTILQFAQHSRLPSSRPPLLPPLLCRSTGRVSTTWSSGRR